jgi:hypothetical protein
MALRRCPTSFGGPVLQDGQFSAGVRQGIKQSNQWRDWIQNNQDEARRARWDDRLGLSGIRPDATGLVLVGRGEPRTELDNVRLRETSKGIEVRTYDWLLRTADHARVGGFGALPTPETSTYDQSLRTRRPYRPVNRPGSS